jgi:signal transduction histidine kinase
VHSDEHAGGCGTTRFCSECGAVKAVLASLAGYNEIQECRLTRMIKGVPQALDLLVHASPLEYNGERFSLFCVSNIADQKRRRVLERIFFHDLINSLGGLDGLMEQIRVQAPDNLKTDLETADAACDSLLEQVLAQRDLAAAEHEDLMVWPTPLNATLLMRQVADLLRLHDVAADRTLRVAPGANAVALATDAVLLKRVLTNLAKNALEACAPGQVVTLGCASEGDSVRFTVHNPGEIPGPVQLQIFNRSFSTKGEGRGLGTYSVKLLAEHYLKGRAGFTSDAETGTTFFVVLPKRLEG